MIFLRAPSWENNVKKLLIIGCAVALAACAAQESALQSTGAAASGETAEKPQTAAERRAEKRKRDENYVSSLERRDRTGSRINRVRRRGEVEEDKPSALRVETVSREELEEMERRGSGPVIDSNE